MRLSDNAIRAAAKAAREWPVGGARCAEHWYSDRSMVDDSEEVPIKADYG